MLAFSACASRSRRAGDFAPCSLPRSFPGCLPSVMRRSPPRRPKTLVEAADPPYTPPVAKDRRGCCSSVVEHSLGKGEVESSILSNSTISAWSIIPPSGSHLARRCYNLREVKRGLQVEPEPRVGVEVAPEADRRNPEPSPPPPSGRCNSLRLHYLFCAGWLPPGGATPWARYGRSLRSNARSPSHSQMVTAAQPRSRSAAAARRSRARFRAILAIQ